MIQSLSQIVVLLTGLYLIVLGAVSILRPALARRFLLAFAGSAHAHYIEMLVRLLAGVAFIVHAPRMRFEDAFGLFGWVLVVTTAGLLLVPWRWHQRFAQRVVPPMTRHLGLLALLSILLGGAIFASWVMDA